MSATRTSDCRKFSPNIFNKSKCSHCFRQREEHSAAALECNRASRKVSKCGYLFVAPDWDFSNPLYRTKRWQRRWFVLYDDGELTYSVDEHPETVPQACIDMTKVLEVTTAEDVTGHTNSIAITAPDRVTFVKGTCPEESKWWLNILAAFPKSKGRHKRNATFPGGQATTILQTNSDAVTTATTRNRHNSYHKDALTSAQSASVLIGSVGGSELVTTHRPRAGIEDDDDDEDDGVETGEDEDDDEEDEADDDDDKMQLGEKDTKGTTSRVGGGGQDENNRNAGNEITNKVSPPCLLIEDIRRDEKTIKDIANTITNLSQQQKNRWSTTTAVNNALNSQRHQSNNSANSSNSKLASDAKSSRDETDFHRPAMTTVLQQQQQSNLRPKSLPLAASSNPAIVSAIVKKIPPVLVTAAASTTASTVGDSNNNNNNSNNNNNKCKSSPRLQLQLKHLQQKHQSNQQRQHKQQQQQHLQQQQQHQSHQHHQQQQQAHERGDPDGGCNLDDLSSHYLAKTAELRVPPVATTAPPTTSTTAAAAAAAAAAEESLTSKKGWLMKQDNRTGDWTKHWFSLSGAALFYYRDAEERGVLDGVLDVNSLTSVAELHAASGKSAFHAFQLTTWDKRRLTLASLSLSARQSWLTVLRHVAGLPQPQPLEPLEVAHVEQSSAAPPASGSKSQLKSELQLKSEIEQDFMKAQRNQELNFTSSIKESAKLTATSPQLLISSSASKTCVTTPMTPITPKSAMHCSSDEEYRTASEGGRRDSVDWGSPLSPSPPTPLTLLRAAKERMRARNAHSPRLHKRSRSSPPSSRRSTVDSVGSDELPLHLHQQPLLEELNIDKELQFRLRLAEQERDMLRDEAQQRETRMSELLSTLERTEQQLNARIQEMEAVRESLSTQLADAKLNAAEIVTRLSEELAAGQQQIKQLEDRLARGIDENDTLYKRLRELETCYSPSVGGGYGNLQRSKLKRMDSLSDLTQISDIDPYGLERDTLAEEYHELRTRFEKAVNEIRAMKRELKQSQNQYDTLEISYAALKQDLERKDEEDRAQMQMMAARIQDLTLKYSGAERQVRTLKQKLTKTERRRSLSLKGSKEQLSIPKELELKLGELEAKCIELERAQLDVKRTTGVEPSTNGSKAASRRRSLESSAGAADSLTFMVRVNELEKRFESVGGSAGTSPTPGTPNSASTRSSLAASSGSGGGGKLSEHLIERLRCLEGVLIASKDRLEQCLQQLHALRGSSRTRRSVSPITSDRKDSYRCVERCLAEVVKLIRESCETCVISGSGYATPCSVLLLPESSPVKLALSQLETQLRGKLAELLQQRRVLRERNELTPPKELELLAQRVAYESVCFGKLREALARVEQPEQYAARQTRAELSETSHLMALLKAKLSGKCALKCSGSQDILAAVLARRLLLSSHRKDAKAAVSTTAPLDARMLDELLRQQHELNVIAKRYKHNALESLAAGLAAETLSYISANDLVQGAVQEAWRQAQETVNAELVHSEIAHIMLRHAERYEQALTPACGYTLSAAERLSFEQYADAVHSALRQQMELAVSQLTQCYEEAMQQMKRGQWRLQLEQQRNAAEGRQLLAEFADIVAHKALIDARIEVLRGEFEGNVATPAQQSDQQQPAAGNNIGITTLQQYEQLFEQLSTDLQLHSAGDVLAEADFEFMYKQQLLDFYQDRQVLSDISSFLEQLEDSLIALQREAAASGSGGNTLPRSAISIDSLQDVCRKCCELRQRADQLLQEVQRKLSTPCPHCLQLRDQLCGRQQQHEHELQRQQQTHTQELHTLRQQLEQQSHALQQLEAEKQAINSDLHRSEQLMEERERELLAADRELQTKDAELRGKRGDQLELLQRLDEQQQQLRSYREESDALTMKCARQDEEYAVLLQERDYLQAELTKEQERSRRLEKRLELLELEHGKQLECLQEAYRDQMLSHCSDFGNAGDDESFRQRYQGEIEQLRTLCEKGLSAMESSHRRIIGDLEEKHRQETERLLNEKETALAEETQATLAALDAMRKAHQSEVQREVARFKQEFLRQFQKGESTLGTTKAKEEELEELRQEILSFSEKYSIKCVENAALEEKLRSVNQKLRQFQQMQQLELRNKQFRAHLAAEDPTTDVNFVQGLSVAKDDDGTCQDSELHAHVSPHTPELKARPPQMPTAAREPPDVLLRGANLIFGSSSNIQVACAAPAAADARHVSPEASKMRGKDVVATPLVEPELNSLNTYEPCYKQTNRYSFQSGQSFEGLRTSSTFGKNLKTLTKTSTNAKYYNEPTTNNAVTMKASSPASSTPSPTTTTTITTHTPTTSTNILLNRIRTPKMQFKQEQTNNLLQPQTTSTTTATATLHFSNINNNNSNNNCNNQKAKEQTLSLDYANNNVYEQYLQKQQTQKQQQQLQQQLLTTTIITPTTTIITKPVEQPKNFSANIYNLKTISHKNYNLNNNAKLLNSSNNNHNNNNSQNNRLVATTEIGTKTATASTTTNLMRIAERTAINLDSFADIIKKTTAGVPPPATTTAATTTATSLATGATQMVAVNASYEQPAMLATMAQTDDVGGDEFQLQQQQQQQRQQPNRNNRSCNNKSNNDNEENKFATTSKSGTTAATTKTTTAAALNDHLCSPPHLSVRDVEHLNVTTTTTTANSKRSSGSSIKSATATTSHLQKFELEI